MSPCGSFFQRLQVLVWVGRQATSLALPEHEAKEFHGLVMSQVDRVKLLGQAFNGLSNAPGLINGALLLNAQMHREVQEGIFFAGVWGVAFIQRLLLIAQIAFVFGMLLNPRGGQSLHAVQGLVEF